MLEQDRGVIVGVVGLIHDGGVIMVGRVTDKAKDITIEISTPRKSQLKTTSYIRI